VAKLVALIFWVFLVPYFLNNAVAAEARITTNGGKVLFVELSGEIQPSDFLIVRNLIDPELGAATDLRTVMLSSPGGDLATAMRIGRYLRFLEFDTVIIKGGRCLSSCVFILASGLSRTALPNEVGIHRPFGTATGFISQDEATSRYRAWAAKVYAYFEEMNIPRALPELMLSIPPEQIRMLSLAELTEFNLNGKDPVAQERDDAANAARYGLSRSEYLVRRARALRECSGPQPMMLDLNCYEAILGRRR
jgi:hypothetical protein